MKSITDLASLDYFQPMAGLKAKLVHTNSQTFAFWEIEKGAVLPEHQHINEQVSIVTSGELELTIDGEMTLMTEGMVAIIPPNINHSAKAITKVDITDVFTPIREDFPNH